MPGSQSRHLRVVSRRMGKQRKPAKPRPASPNRFGWNGYIIKRLSEPNSPFKLEHLDTAPRRGDTKRPEETP